MKILFSQFQWRPSFCHRLSIPYAIFLRTEAREKRAHPPLCICRLPALSGPPGTMQIQLINNRTCYDRWLPFKQLMNIHILQNTSTYAQALLTPKLKQIIKILFYFKVFILVASVSGLKRERSWTGTL